MGNCLSGETVRNTSRAEPIHAGAAPDASSCSLASNTNISNATIVNHANPGCESTMQKRSDDSNNINRPPLTCATRHQHQMQEQQRHKLDTLRKEVVAAIKEHNSKSLRWGTPEANCFPAKMQPWGMVGRNEQFQQVLELLRQVRTAETPAERPAIVLFGTRHQGMSAFLRELATSKDSVTALSGKHEDDDDARIFNRKCMFVYAPNLRLKRSGAEREVAVQLLSAAAGLHHRGHAARRVACFVELQQMTIEQAVQLLRDIGTIKADSPTLFCFDWFTSILRRIPDPQDRLHFYKAFHSALVTKHSTVITTCYGTRQITECAAAAAAVGRRTEFIEMSLARTLQDRRSMLVLHAALIRCAVPPQSSSNDNENTSQQLPKAQDAADALYLSELLRFSPGVMAHIVNDIAFVPDTAKNKSILDRVFHFNKAWWAGWTGNVLCKSLAVLSVSSKQLLVGSAAAVKLVDRAEYDKPGFVSVTRSFTADARPISITAEPRWLESASRGRSFDCRVLRAYFGMLKRFALNYVTAPTAQAAALIRAATIRNAVFYGLLIQPALRWYLSEELGVAHVNAPKDVCGLNEWLGCEPLLVAGMQLPSMVEFSPNCCCYYASATCAVASGGYPVLTTSNWSADRFGAVAKLERCLSSSPNAAYVDMPFLAPEQWNNSLHQPIIFHEYVADTHCKRLIQFWVQVKHKADETIIDHAEFDKWCLRDPTPPSATANTTTTAQASPTHSTGELVHLGLSNEILQHPNCIVDHVVHIVLTPVQVKQDGTKIVKRSVDARLGRLKSYSLYVVNPGTAGFENLVSQPVALTMPLMDSHDDADSWMEPVPHDVSKWKDYIGVKRGLSASIQDDKERAVYEKLVADNESQLKEWEMRLADRTRKHQQRLQEKAPTQQQEQHQQQATAAGQAVKPVNDDD